MKSTKPLLFSSDYDETGKLKLPWLFWGVLLLQVRSLWLAMHSVAFEGRHFEGFDTFCALFPGIPALIVFAMVGRGRFYWCWSFWCSGRWILIFGQWLQPGWLLFNWLNGEPITAWSVVFFIANLLALYWVHTSQRLWACFTHEYGYSSFHYKNIHY
ncbi:DUF2919 family protein [Pseudocitrobacter vendiensis]|uniref:DUF2919 domain-containing protein n=1 Tax=Pseudocitrobacter vendiensis TaxID=2488306 RepID=A0ABM9F962_9ENTR|nr:DUF2919 family protein [Pseudocitrobacter vendiensis]CAH6659671.1 DUF2919 domain-containing protein [Pseudocitrobacter vendiensis]